jgi:hypothetical protein
VDQQAATSRWSGRQRIASIAHAKRLHPRGFVEHVLELMWTASRSRRPRDFGLLHQRPLTEQECEEMVGPGEYGCRRGDFWNFRTDALKAGLGVGGDEESRDGWQGD